MKIRALKSGSGRVESDLGLGGSFIKEPVLYPWWANRAEVDCLLMLFKRFLRKLPCVRPSCVCERVRFVRFTFFFTIFSPISYDVISRIQTRLLWVQATNKK